MTPHPPEIYLRVKYDILTPMIFRKEIFSGTHSHVLIEATSGIRSRTVFLVIIYNRFVDSSKCGPHNFDPQSKDSPTRLFILHIVKALFQLVPGLRISAQKAPCENYWESSVR